MRHIMIFAYLLFCTASSSLQAQLDLGEAVHQLAAKIQDNLDEQKKRRVAVLPFRMNGGERNALCTYIAEELIGNFVESRRLDIVERGLLDDVIEEIDRGESGVIDPETARKVKIKGADAILTGTVTDLSTYVAVNGRLIDTETGLVFAAAQVKILRDDNVRKLLDPAFAALPTTNNTLRSEEAAKGWRSGLRGEYFNSPPFEKAPSFPEQAEYVRIDKAIDFDWGKGVPAPRISSDYFLVRWSGEIYAPVTGTYKFRSNHNDGCRLSIGGKAIFREFLLDDGYKPNYVGTASSPSGFRLYIAEGYIYLKGPAWHPIEIEFIESTAYSAINIHWLPPGETDLQIIPTNSLRARE